MERIDPFKEDPEEGLDPDQLAMATAIAELLTDDDELEMRLRLVELVSGMMTDTEVDQVLKELTVGGDSPLGPRGEEQDGREESQED
jgi:hypothetical protein